MGEPKPPIEQRLSVTTFRISEIPISVSKPELLENVQRILGLDSSGAILHSSLALSPVDQARFQVSTMTFDHIPPQLVSCVGSREQVRLDIAIGGVTSQISFDTHFLGLTPLNDGMRLYDVDLIFVTGLAGHAFGSWKARGKRTMWVRDFLGGDLDDGVAGGIRILTYGYDSTLLANDSNAGVSEFARAFLEAIENARRLPHEIRRPIVFVGHSLGGIVVKQALVQAAVGSENDRHVHRATYACIFLGVPNLGLEIVQLIAMVKGQRNERLVTDLGIGSQYLQVLHSGFREALNVARYRVISVYETKLSRAVAQSETGKWQKTGPLIEMVTKESAVLCTPADAPHDLLPRDVDHSDLAKFGSREDKDYLVLRRGIIECLNEAPGVISQRLLDAQTNQRKPRKRMAPTVTEQDCFNNFKAFIKHEKQGLQVFYADDSALWKLVPNAQTMAGRLLAMGYMKQTSLDLSILILYDVALLLDDNSSANADEGGQRVDHLRRYVHAITSIYDLANPAGIKSVKFVTAKRTAADVRNKNWENMVHWCKNDGVTGLGTALRQKILKHLVWRNPMTKPLLVMIVTNGDSEGEREGLLEDVIEMCIGKLSKDPSRGKQAVAFHFSHVGDDEYGRDRLRNMAASDSIGEYVDCGGHLERLEDPEQRHKYVVMPKLLLGAIVGHWKEVEEEFDVLSDLDG